jgi:hypothetical protein
MARKSPQVIRSSLDWQIAMSSPMNTVKINIKKKKKKKNKKKRKKKKRKESTLEAPEKRREFLDFVIEGVASVRV